MEKVVNWWKQDKRYMILVKVVLMALLPILCCLVYCATQGRSISQVSLAMSEWNDELFYYKQVEGIVNYGFPQGFFGFDESHALKLSFAAWSPVLVFPWIFWGLLFGWNMLSPMICNILLLTLAMIIFVLLTRPNWKQVGVLTLLFCLYTPFVRYMLSGMPEIICISMLIIFYSIAVNYLRKEKVYKLVLLFVLAGLLTLMRPYMLLFLLLPMFFWIRKQKWWGVLGSACVLAVVLGIYVFIKHYLGAEYFTPLFFTDWITTFFEKGFFEGVHHFFGKLYWMGKSFAAYTIEGFRSGLAAGAFFGGYLIMLLVFLWQTISDFRQYRKKKTESPLLILEGHMLFCFIGMLFALLLMYKLTEGSKHLLTFMGVGIFLISLMKTQFYKKAVIICGAFAYLYSYRALEPYDYMVPFQDSVRQEQLANAQEALEQEMVLQRERVPNFENVCIWVLNDLVETDNDKTEIGTNTGIEIDTGTDTDTNLVTKSTKWQLLYALPKGFGISCCQGSYVRENLDTLQSRYLATIVDGEIDEQCKELGYPELYRDHEVVFYKRN